MKTTLNYVIMYIEKRSVKKLATLNLLWVSQSFALQPPQSLRDSSPTIRWGASYELAHQCGL